MIKVKHSMLYSIAAILTISFALALLTYQNSRKNRKGSEIEPRLEAGIEDQLIQNARKVKERDSFVEVSELVPMIKCFRPFNGEHGGTWYFVPIGSDYVLSLRFSPKIPDKADGIATDLNKSLVNRPPVLRRVDKVNKQETIHK